MTVDVGDVIAIAALMVFLSVVLLGYIDPRRREGLVYVRYLRADDVLAIVSIMVLLSMFLLWW